MKVRGNTKGAKRSAENIVVTNSPLKRRKQEKKTELTNSIFP
jgi:hypothetical protein